MKLIDDQIDEYIDRHMERLIEEWELATRRDITHFTKRVKALEREIDPLREFEVYASERLTNLEERLKQVKEGL